MYKSQLVYTLCSYSPLILLEISALVLNLMAETQLDQIMHKVPLHILSARKYTRSYFYFMLPL